MGNKYSALVMGNKYSALVKRGFVKQEHKTVHKNKWEKIYLCLLRRAEWMEMKAKNYVTHLNFDYCYMVSAPYYQYIGHGLYSYVSYTKRCATWEEGQLFFEECARLHINGEIFLETT